MFFKKSIQSMRSYQKMYLRPIAIGYPRVDEMQYQVDACCKRLHIYPPHVHVIQENQENAHFVPLSKKYSLLLISWGSYVNLPYDELKFELYHELGHAYEFQTNSHVKSLRVNQLLYWYMFYYISINCCLVFFLLHLISSIPWNRYIILAILLFDLISFIILSNLGSYYNKNSKQQELNADTFAVNQTHDKQSAIEALIDIHKQVHYMVHHGYHFSNSPDKHPSLQVRIKNVKKIK